MVDFFVSYATADGAQHARDLVAAVERSARRCWMAARDVTPGAPYPEQIVAAIAESRAMVVLATPAANRSWDVAREVKLAADRELRTIPVLFPGATLSPTLEYFFALPHRLEWRGAPELCGQLLAALERGDPIADAAQDAAQEGSPPDIAAGRVRSFKDFRKVVPLSDSRLRRMVARGRVTKPPRKRLRGHVMRHFSDAWIAENWEPLNDAVKETG